MDYEEQLSAAKFRAERDQARQEVKELREELDAIKAEREYDVKALNHRIAEMEPRLMPEGMEWLRYDTGEPVPLGGEVKVTVHDEDGDFDRTFAIRSIKYKENGVLLEGAGNEMVILSHGERVKRPQVIAADGEPLEAGQTVYVIANGKTHHVTETDTVSKRFRSMEQVDGSHWLDPMCFTHERPVLDTDGVPIKKGDTVWFVGGGEPAEVAYTITADASHPDEVVLKGYEDDWPVNADRLTHAKPEIDSWERIEEDAERIDETRLWGDRTPDARDLVRRAKALAGVSE